jgi:putative nucleotidyltransferase with HDIG domain
VDGIIGQTLGSFKILSLLGEGGMGRVYLAEHVLIGRRAAIKVLAAEIADKEDIVSRFFTEARAVNDIRHPNIVEVTDFGTFGRQPFIVMELLDGETLEQRLARVSLLDLDAAARVVTQIASAVGAGHEHGMVHRDLKPANIFLRNHPDYPDFVKVLDFGIAKLVAGDRNVQHHTEIGMLIGTPAYMSPEQCLGDTHLDHHSDIYSLGVVLYQMVTGRLPFTAETAGRLIVCHVQEEPPPPQQINPAVSPAMGAVITKAMAKKPEHRFASMREMRDAVLLAAPAAFAFRDPASITPPPVVFTAPSASPAAPARSTPAGTQLGSAPTTYSPSSAPSGLGSRPQMRSAPPAGQTLPSGYPLTGSVTPPPARPPVTNLAPSYAPSPAPSSRSNPESTSASGSSTLADRLVEILKSRTSMDIDIELPQMPRSILRCLDLLGAPDFSFGGMAALLASDAKLAGQLAQVANTTGPSHTPARSTEQAIARLGAEGVRTGLFEIALRPLFDSASPRLQAVCKQPWQHALAVAMIAQRLMHLHGANEGALLEAYRTGLFHDAGKPITAAMLLEIERQMTNAKGRKIINEEMLTGCIDRCHATPGARLARAWGLPPDAASAIELADQPQTPGFNLAAVIRLANALAYKGGFHTRRDELDRSRLLVDEARRAAGCDEEMCHRALDGVKDAVSRRL